MLILGISASGGHCRLALLDGQTLVASTTVPLATTQAATPATGHLSRALADFLPRTQSDPSEIGHIAIAENGVAEAAPAWLPGLLRTPPPRHPPELPSIERTDSSIFDAIRQAWPTQFTRLAGQISWHNDVVARANAAFYASSFADALVVTWPRMAPRQHCYVHLGSPSEVRHLRTIPWSDTPGLLLHAVNVALGAGPDTACRIAQLGRAGAPRFADAMTEALVQITKDGRCVARSALLAWPEEPMKARQILHDLAGTVPSSAASGACTAEADLAASALAVFHLWAKTLLDHYTLAYAEPNLCMVGEVVDGANLVSSLLASGPVRDICNAPDDGGIAPAVGAALIAQRVLSRQSGEPTPAPKADAAAPHASLGEAVARQSPPDVPRTARNPNAVASRADALRPTSAVGVAIPITS